MNVQILIINIYLISIVISFQNLKFDIPIVQSFSTTTISNMDPNLSDVFDKIAPKSKEDV